MYRIDVQLSTKAFRIRLFFALAPFPRFDMISASHEFKVGQLRKHKLAAQCEAVLAARRFLVVAQEI